MFPLGVSVWKSLTWLSRAFSVALHRPTALRCSTVAIAFGIIAIVQIVFIRQLFARRDVTDSHHEYSSLVILRLAIRVARVVNEHRRSKAVDYLPVISTAEQVGHEAIFIPLIGLFFCKTRTIVLTNTRAFFYHLRGIATRRMYRRRTNNQPINHNLKRPIK